MQILIKNKGANFDKDTTEFEKANDQIDIGYIKSDDTFHFTIDIGLGDHFLCFDVNANDLVKVLKEVLTNPD